MSISHLLPDVDGTETKITSDHGEMPQWSPDGARIAYGLSGGLVTIKADGKRRSWIVSPESDWLFRWPHWSPDSGHLVFTGLPKTGSGVYSATGDLFLVSANGRDMVNLTDSPDSRESTTAGYAGWR